MSRRGRQDLAQGLDGSDVVNWSTSAYSASTTLASSPVTLRMRPRTPTIE